MAVDLSKLSDAELEAISSGNLASLSDETLRMLSGEPQGDYRAEALRKGPASSLGLVTGLANVASEAASRMGLNPMELGMRAGEATRRALGLTAPPPAPPRVQQTYGEAFARGREPVYQGTMSLLGSTGAEPQTVGQKIVAGGLQAATSPESYLFPPIAAVRRLGLFGQAVARPTEQAVVGSGAEAGGEAGAYAGAKVGSETTGRILGGVVGGGGTAYAGGKRLGLSRLLAKVLMLSKANGTRSRALSPRTRFSKKLIGASATFSTPRLRPTLTFARLSKMPSARSKACL